MKKPFGSLRIGEKFYIPVKGRINLNYQYIKVSEMILPDSGEPNCLVTTGAFQHARFNCVMIESPDNLKGYFHFLHDNDLVYPENYV